jgi:hypothetical protein
MGTLFSLVVAPVILALLGIVAAVAIGLLTRRPSGGPRGGA